MHCSSIAINSVIISSSMYLINAALNVLLNIVYMIGLIVDDTYPNQRQTSVTWSGTGQSSFGQTANRIFNKKNGDQHNTNVKNTTPSTLLAFCSVLTAFAAAKLWRFCLFARNLENKKKNNKNKFRKCFFN